MMLNLVGADLSSLGTSNLAFGKSFGTVLKSLCMAVRKTFKTILSSPLVNQSVVNLSVMNILVHGGNDD
jgi:hypothetical protein